MASYKFFKQNVEYSTQGTELETNKEKGCWIYVSRKRDRE